MSRRQPLKDNVAEQRIIQFRILLALAVVFFLVLVIIYRFYTLQISHYEIYKTESESNRMRLERIPPKRGLILDAEQRLLADNKPSYMLALARDKITDIPHVIAELKRIGVVSDEDIEKFWKFSNRYHAFEAVPIRFNLSDEDMARVAENRLRLDGVEVTANLVRYYPYGDLLTHMVGYVARISEKELPELDQDNYGATNHIGKIGVEKSYESQLHGTVGYQYVETNVHGVVLRTLERTDPVPGNNIELYLNLDMQRVAYDALGESRGAVVALNPKNGGVLAAVSRPSYDPNLFVNGISFEDYNALRENIDIPLFNRIIQAQYPPGSTVKPIVGLAGLEERIVTEQTVVRDPGYYKLPGSEHQYRDWKREGHGNSIDFRASIEQSCDVYYYTLAHKMGIRNLHTYFDHFGLGQKTGIDVPEERRGINPSPEWKKSQGRSEWYTGDSLNIGIGQGFLLVTPLQLAYATSIIANRGQRYVPHMVARIGTETVEPVKLEPLVLQDEKHWDSVINAMVAVVHGSRGTAQGIGRGISYHIAGKTGTAQVVAIKQGEKYDARLVAARQRDHALFIAFAPAEAPEIVVAVVVENGEHGSSTAAPVARKVIDEWLRKIGKIEKNE